MDPRGSRVRGKKNKQAQKRWDQVAMAIYDITVIASEGDTVDANNWEDATDEDRDLAYGIADAAIRLVDNLLAPAIARELKAKR